MTKGYPHVHAKVLMVGPDLSLHGGIVSVVKGYLDAGLPEACDAFEYLGTGIGSSKLGKSVAFSRALIRYAMIMPSYDIIHLHISARGSYKRKSIMARMAHKAGKYVILHDHDGEFKKAFEEGGDPIAGSDTVSFVPNHTHKSITPFWVRKKQLILRLTALFVVILSCPNCNFNFID